MPILIFCVNLAIFFVVILYAVKFGVKQAFKELQAEGILPTAAKQPEDIKTPDAL